MTRRGDSFNSFTSDLAPEEVRVLSAYFLKSFDFLRIAQLMRVDEVIVYEHYVNAMNKIKNLDEFLVWTRSQANEQTVS